MRHEEKTTTKANLFAAPLAPRQKISAIEIDNEKYEIRITFVDCQKSVRFMQRLDRMNTPEILSYRRSLGGNTIVIRHHELRDPKDIIDYFREYQANLPEPTSLQDFVKRIEGP